MLGLGGVGKTSYFEVLQQEFGALYNLNPTIGVNMKKIKIFGTNIFVWDYGGQQGFRENYLRDSERYLGGIDLLFFFVDVQDPDNIDAALDYFQRLMSLPQLTDFDSSRVHVLLHKMDPEIRNDPRIRLRTNKIKEKFNFIRRANYFETSIHDYWSIIFSFSAAFKSIKSIGEVINKLLKEFARATFSSGVILTDKRFLIMDKHASSPENYRIIDDGFQLIVNKWAEEAARNNQAKTLQIGLRSGKGYLQQFTYEDEVYYIMSYSRNPRTEKLILEKLPELGNRVFEILMGYSHEILFQ